ncbi:hypothetical protein Dimus_035286 [Dionaea muscipula]
MFSWCGFSVCWRLIAEVAVLHFGCSWAAGCIGVLCSDGVSLVLRRVFFYICLYSGKKLIKATFSSFTQTHTRMPVSLARLAVSQKRHLRHSHQIYSGKSASSIRLALH